MRDRQRTPEVPRILTESTYSTFEVSEATGATMRQLQWWDERHLVTVRHAGHRRFYTPEDLRFIGLIVMLRSKGVSIQKIRNVLRSAGPRLRDTIAPDHFLVTDGKTGKVVSSVILPDVCAGFRSMVAVVPLLGTANGNGDGTKVPAGGKRKGVRV